MGAIIDCSSKKNKKDGRRTAGGQGWAALEEAKKAEGRKMTCSLTWVIRFQSGTDSRRSDSLSLLKNPGQLLRASQVPSMVLDVILA